MLIFNEMLYINLYQIIKDRKFAGLGLSHIQLILKDVLHQLSIIHQLGLIHADIKLENILQISMTNIHVKLIDFGCCCFPEETPVTLQTPCYRAPEVVLNIPYDAKIDIWSVGCVAAELMLGLPIFYAFDDANIIYLHVLRIGQIPESMVNKSPLKNIYFGSDGQLKSKEELEALNGQPFQNDRFVANKVDYTIRNYPFPVGASEDFISREKPRREVFLDLVQKMLTIDPDSRPTAVDLLNHPFFSLEL